MLCQHSDPFQMPLVSWKHFDSVHILELERGQEFDYTPMRSWSPEGRVMLNLRFLVSFQLVYCVTWQNGDLYLLIEKCDGDGLDCWWVLDAEFWNFSLRIIMNFVAGCVALENNQFHHQFLLQRFTKLVSHEVVVGMHNCKPPKWVGILTHRNKTSADFEKCVSVVLRENVSEWRVSLLGHWWIWRAYKLPISS